MTTKKQKVLFVVIGLAATLLLLEASLRLAGFIYKTYRINNKKSITKENKDAVKILCLGDSFTFGLGAEHGYSYPAQLEELLNKNYQDKKFIVYNRGIPGQNSSMVLKRLVRNIKTYRPDTILLLIGSNNRTVLEDSNYYLFKEHKIGKIAAFFLKLDIALSKLRSYKLIRITILNFKNKLKSKIDLLDAKVQKKLGKSKDVLNKIPKENFDDKETYLRLTESLYAEKKFSAAEKIIKEIPEGYNPRDKKECFILSNIYYEQEKYDLALAVMEEYIKDNPKDPDALFNLGRIYYKRGRRESPTVKEENFERALRVFEESLLYIDSSNLSLKAEIYSYLAQLYFDEGEKELAIKMIEEALKYYPDNNFFRQFRRVIDEPSLSPEENEDFNKLLYYDLGRIINLCHIYNVKIILLNYPCETKGSYRKEIADKYKIPFVDIGSEFAELLSNKYNYKDLFSNDMDHPNADGYRVIAEAVFKVLKHQIEVLR